MFLASQARACVQREAGLGIRQAGNRTKKRLRFKEVVMERVVRFKLNTCSINTPPERPKDPSRKTAADAPAVKVLGRLCPCCGVAGAVLYVSKSRIIYECPNEHVFETEMRTESS